MRKIEIGDTLMSQGTVVELDVDSSVYRITSPTGSNRWVHSSIYQLVEPPPFKVGDRVIPKIVAGQGSIGTIAEIKPQETRYHVVDADGDNMGLFFGGCLEPAPPKPEYHVVRVNDELRLRRLDNPDAEWWSARVPMSAGPEAIEKDIVEWARDYGIDADAARELAAEPEVIETMCPTEGALAVAIRHGKGWYVRISVTYRENAKDAARYGLALDEAAGRKNFPKTNGPYEEKP